MSHPLVPIAAMATLALASAAPARAMGAAGATTSVARPPSSNGAGAASAAASTAQSRTPTLGTSPSDRATGAPGAAPGQLAAGATPNTAPNTSPTTAPAGSTTSPPAGGATSSTAPSRPPALVGGPFGSTNRARGSARDGIGHISALAIVIAAVGASLALACAAWGLARRRAVEPHWWLSFQHTMAEARHRASATWAEFTDWARLGH
jgi:hypothetical protein